MHPVKWTRLAAVGGGQGSRQSRGGIPLPLVRFGLGHAPKVPDTQQTTRTTCHPGVPLPPICPLSRGPLYFVLQIAGGYSLCLLTERLLVPLLASPSSSVPVGRAAPFTFCSIHLYSSPDSLHSPRYLPAVPLRLFSLLAAAVVLPLPSVAKPLLPATPFAAESSAPSRSVAPTLPISRLLYRPPRRTLALSAPPRSTDPISLWPPFSRPTFSRRRYRGSSVPKTTCPPTRYPRRQNERRSRPSQ